MRELAVRGLSGARRPPSRAAPRRAAVEAARSPSVPDRFNQVQIYAGTCYPLDHDISHYYTSLVFSTAFGESMSCRLFQKLREELGLCYTVYSFRSFFSDTGMWTIYANSTPGQAGKFLHALDRELTRLLEEPLSSAEIEDAKSHLVGSMILSREDMETRMKRLVRQQMMMNRILSFDESVAALRGVTDAPWKRFARQCLRRDAFSLLAYGSRRIERPARIRFHFPGRRIARRARDRAAERAECRAAEVRYRRWSRRYSARAASPSRNTSPRARPAPTSARSWTRSSS